MDPKSPDPLPAGKRLRVPHAPYPAVAVGLDRAAGRRRSVRRAWLRSLPVFVFSTLLHGLGAWLIFEAESGQRVVLDRAEAGRAHEEILAFYGIASDRSPDLAAVRVRSP